MPTYYKRNTSGTTSWNLATSWSTVSSTSAVNTGTFPSSTTADPVIFDANSSNVTVNVLSTCTSLDFTTYTGTITMTNTLFVYGNVTLGVSMGIAGTGALTISAVSTYTSNGVIWTSTLQLNTPGASSYAITLGDVCTVQNLSNTGGFASNIISLNGNSLNILGNLTILTTLAGSTQINLTGTGTWNSVNAGIEVRTKLNIDTLGTITRGANGCAYSGPELKYTKGTLVNGTTNLGLSAGGNTLSIISNGVNWGNVFIYTNTTTLSDDMNVNDFIFSSNSAVLNGSNLRINSNITLGAGVPILTGTTVLQIIGTGSQSWTGTARISTPIVINKSGGTLTLVGTLNYGGSSLTYTAGSINPGSSTFNTISGVSSIISGMTFWNLTIPGTSTTTQNSTNTIQNNLTLASTGNTAFTGSAGWTCVNLICSNTPRTITLANSSTGATYRTTTSASLIATSASRITMTSDNATTRSLWTLDYGAQQSLIYINGTRIDSSLGQQVWTFDGVRTDTINWNTGSRPGTSAYTFVN